MRECVCVCMRVRVCVCASERAWCARGYPCDTITHPLQGHLANTAAGKGGSGSGHQLVADMAKEVEALRAQLVASDSALGNEKAAVAR